MIWGFAGISDSFLVAVFSVNQLHAAVPVYRLAFSQRAPRNARPHEVGGGARFDYVGSTQEFTCYVAGFASRGDHTCGWTTSTLHSHLAWRYWFRWGCGASSTSSLRVVFLAGTVHMLASNRPRPRSTALDTTAMH